MKLGIGLPNWLTPGLNRGMFIDWCRAADEGGFHIAGTLDQPSSDSWEPMASLAIAAGVTERIGLATTVMQLPTRNEIVVAKQAAVIDRVSGGRMTLGVAVGAREEDYQALGMKTKFKRRGKNIDRQIRKIRRTWRAAKRTTDENPLTGPAPLQKPLPPIWVGGKVEASYARAVEHGDGFMFGAVPVETVREVAPKIRERLDEKKAKKFQIAAMAYVAVGDDPAVAMEAGSPAIARYYRGFRDPESVITAGNPDTIAALAATFDEAGADVLLLFPTIPDVKQVQILAEQVVPTYRVPASR